MHIHDTFTEARIRTMTKEQLVAAQRPYELQMRYSLNCCQGDGVSFTGRLSIEDLLCFTVGLLARDLLSDEAASRLQLFILLHHSTLLLVCCSHHYSHSGIVELIAHNIAEDLETAKLILLNALNALNREYEAICVRVEIRGYRIIASTHLKKHNYMLFVRSTNHIELRAAVRAPYDMEYCVEEEKTLMKYFAMIENGVRIPGIEMQVWCNGQLMA